MIKTNVSPEVALDAREIYGVDLVSLIEAHHRNFGSENPPIISINRLVENGEDVGFRVDVRKAVTKSSTLLEKWEDIRAKINNVVERISARISSGNATQEELEQYKAQVTELNGELTYAYQAYLDKLDAEGTKSATERQLELVKERGADPKDIEWFERKVAREKETPEQRRERVLNG